ncbi:hypothetical protein JOC77_002549 [Peribacillus deserti]|uniref:Uncharacterized protein n=1 Tax=Peribacillus deserti TaxID=673318 RepID=A0ABS2QIX9_9BACI|nr:hypothetical protein [Peribacillus deserti]MBM7693110.1 hypothetical protein [Peribacillus deserti]
MEQHVRYQRKAGLSGIREEFGTELTGDMNASKLYETLQVAHDKNTDKENYNKNE